MAKEEAQVAELEASTKLNQSGMERNYDGNLPKC